MQNRRMTAPVLCVVASVAMGCALVDLGDTPSTAPCDATPPSSGAYVSIPTRTWGEGVLAPRADSEKRVDLDLATGRLTVEYERNGASVVEVWRIEGRDEVGF